MIRNYFKVALRAILRSKLTSFINIAGLAFAMTCCLLIWLFISDEFKYDRYNSKADRVYRFTREFLSPDGSSTLHLGHIAPPFGPLLKNDFPDFEFVARTRQFRRLMSNQENSGSKKVFNEDNLFFAEPDLLNIFDVNITEGSREKALREPFTILVSAKAAHRYFGNEDPQGKTLRMNDKFDFAVTGVFDDFPAQAHWHPEFLASFSTLDDSTVYGKRALESNYGNNSFATYALAKEKFLDTKKIESQFPAFLDRHMGANAKKNEPLPSSWTRLYVQKLTDIHLRSNLDSEIEPNGSIRNVNMMAVIGIFIILIACFNFVNLSTAQATKRSKEAGLRKVVGALRHQLISQYLSESVLTSFFALALAVGISFVALHWLNQFTGKSIALSFHQWPLFAGGLAFALLVGLLAGIYPAFVVSGFKPALVLKGQAGSVKGKGGIRKTLVVAQFAISIGLIIATAVTFRQLDFMNKRDLGYEQNQIITFNSYKEIDDQYQSFYNELVKNSAIRNVGRSSIMPSDRLDNYDDARVQKGDSMVRTSLIIKNVSADENFFDTYGVKLVAGRNFSRAIKSDDSIAYIVNEAAVKIAGWNLDEAVGKDFQYGDRRGKIIGVVHDFHFESLHQAIAPVVFIMDRDLSRISVKLSGRDMQAGIAHVEKLWQQFVPNRPFEYVFNSERVKHLYQNEQKQSQLFTVFSGLAIFIACLGLFGLATFNTLQRVKEIGVRKVLGASVSNILVLLSKEMVWLIVIANLIAWPAAWYFMNSWLESFAYKTNLPPGIFIVASLSAIAVALLTVSAQTIRAAMTNPASTLRSE